LGTADQDTFAWLQTGDDFRLRARLQTDMDDALLATFVGNDGDPVRLPRLIVVLGEPAG
jgi:hypothetical protein